MTAPGAPSPHVPDGIAGVCPFGDGPRGLTSRIRVRVDEVFGRAMIYTYDGECGTVLFLDAADLRHMSALFTEFAGKLEAAAS